MHVCTHTNYGCTEAMDETYNVFMYAAVSNTAHLFLMNREYSTLKAQVRTEINEVPREELIKGVSKQII